MAANPLADMKSYAQAIDRLSGVFALASLVPIIFASRFGRQGQPDRLRKEEEAEDVYKEKEAERPSSVGVPCILLLVASEVLGSSELFQPGTGTLKGGAKGRSYVGFPALIKGIEKGKKSLKPGVGTFDNIISLLTGFLELPGSFKAARSIFMLLGCAIVLASMLYRAVSKVGGTRGGGRARVAIVGAMWPLFVFGWLHQSTLLKVWKAMAAEQLLPTLQLPCRALALIFATLPDGARSPTPSLFAALQVASLVAGLSAELARGELAKAAAPLVRLPPQLAVLEPSLYVLLVPTLLSVSWLVGGHLHRNLGSLGLTSFLTACVSPGILTKGWPEVCLFLGLGAGKQVVPALVRISSLSLAAAGASIFVSGGAQGLLACMMMVQILAQIHGHEELLAALS